MRIEPNEIITPHFTHVRTGDELEQYTFTGILLIGFTGARGDWKREQFDFYLAFPDRPVGKVLQLKYWAPFVTINALETIDDQGGDQARGYAVDSFRILKPREIAEGYIVQSDVAIRDVDSTLHRLGYNVTLVGTWVDSPLGPG